MEDKKNDEAKVPAEPSPNIMFVGRTTRIINTKDGPKEEEVKLDPLNGIQNGMEKIVMPAADVQRKPFFHKRASTIISLFPDLYKNYIGN